MSLGPYRPTSSSAKPHADIGVPPVPAALVGLLLLIAAMLAVIFIVAAQTVHPL